MIMNKKEEGYKMKTIILMNAILRDHSLIVAFGIVLVIVIACTR